MSDPQPIGGRYTLLEPLVGGEVGLAWRARDLETGTDRVIRVLPLGAASGRARLLGVLDAVAHLAHPGLVAVEDVVAGDERWALVTRLIPGESLAARLARGGPLPAGEAADLIAQLCDALAAAHAAGLAHGRVTPSNLLLEPRADAPPAVRLTDFGLASLESWAAHGRSPDPAAAAVRARYRPPEWIPGMPSTPAGDVYAVGAVLYEALAGEPMPGRTLAVRPDGEPPRPPGAPDVLWALLTACLAKRPRLRPAAADVTPLLRPATPALAGPRHAVGAVAGRARRAASRTSPPRSRAARETPADAAPRRPDATTAPADTGRTTRDNPADVPGQSPSAGPETDGAGRGGAGGRRRAAVAGATADGAGRAAHDDPAGVAGHHAGRRTGDAGAAADGAGRDTRDDPADVPRRNAGRRRVGVAGAGVVLAAFGGLMFALGGHLAGTHTGPAPEGAGAGPASGTSGPGGVAVVLSSTYGAGAGGLRSLPGTPSSPGAAPGPDGTIAATTAPAGGGPTTTGGGGAAPTSNPGGAPTTTAGGPSGGLPVSDPIGYLESLRSMIQQLAAEGSAVIDANAAGDLENLVLDLENAVNSYQQNGGQSLLDQIKQKIASFDARLTQLQNQGLISASAASELAAYLQKLSPS